VIRDSFGGTAWWNVDSLLDINRTPDVSLPRSQLSHSRAVHANWGSFTRHLDSHHGRTPRYGTGGFACNPSQHRPTRRFDRFRWLVFFFSFHPDLVSCVLSLCL